MSAFQPLVLAPLLGVLIGLVLGMLGGGGSILTVPILVYLLRQDPHTAVATSLVIVDANALTGAWLHRREGHVRLKQALLFGSAGIPAAYGAARLSKLLDGPMLLVLFALLMLVIAALIVRGGITPGEVRSPPSIVGWRVLLGGIGVGFLTGFLGVGGGFVIVPALVLFLGMEMPEAVGSSLVVIAFNSAAGLVGHLSGQALPWPMIPVFVLAGVAGLLLGTRASRRLSPARLRQSFAGFVVVLALLLLAINVPAVLPV